MLGNADSMRPEASNNPKVVSDLVSLTLFHTKSQGAKNRLSGKLPLWLWSALALAYAHVPWLGVYQPQQGAVIIHAIDAQKIGRLVQAKQN